ncbi:hypothetical protein [Haloarcula litorea]|uniref:hypothetical protein n=1 Tax=Haloarcula litorea TaxID=3032579 RepID=UPI0023E8D63A|nr:hypothetical protein [Halomicroarcula sp. GDY20]
MRRTRRAILTGVAALFAGCGQVSDGTDGPADPPTEQQPRETATDGSSETDTGTDSLDDHTEGPDCQEGTIVNANRFDPVEQLPLAPAGEDRTLVEAAVRDGGAEATSYHHEPPVPSGAYVAVDGRYYRLRADRTDSSEVPALVMGVEWRKGRTAPDGTDVVDFESLPEADRAALRYVVFGGGPERQELPSRGLSASQRPVPYPDGVGASRFAAADGSVWVRWKDREWEVWSDGRTTKDRYTYRVGVEAVADTDEAFRSHVRETYLLARSRFDAGEREILRAAAADQHRECAPVSDAMASLRETLSEDATLPPPFGYSWLVELDDGVYHVETMEWTV